MKIVQRTGVRIAAWTGVGVIALGIAAGAAEAHSTASRGGGATASTAAGTGTGVGDAAAAKGRRAWGRGGLGGMRRTVHGEFVVRTKDGYRTVDLQRGTIASVNATTLQVTSPDGFSATYAVGSATHVRKNRQKSTIAALAKGDKVVVLATAGNPKTAQLVVVPAARPDKAGARQQGAQGAAMSMMLSDG